MLDAAVDIAFEQFGCALRSLAYVERDSAAAAYAFHTLLSRAIEPEPSGGEPVAQRERIRKQP